MISRIKKKLDSLINLMLTDGVQPSEIADNIFISEYKSIHYFKQNDFIIGELIFEEQIGETITDTALRYYYSISKQIIKIEEEIFGKKEVIWDRFTQEHQIIDDVVNLLSKSYSDCQMEKFISSLPEEIKKKITDTLQEVA